MYTYAHICIICVYVYISHIHIYIYTHMSRRTASPPCNTLQHTATHCNTTASPPNQSTGWRTVTGCHLYMSFSAKEPYNWWLFFGKWPATEGILWVFATLFIYTHTHICIIYIYVYVRCLHQTPVYICIYTYLHNICIHRRTISPTHHSININVHMLS